MLNELVRRFSGRPPQRRAGDRVRKPYPISWLRGAEPVAAAGVEIGDHGLLFATRTPPPGPRVDVLLDLDGRRVRARMTIGRQAPVVRDGVTWTLIAAAYEGIAADDWDAIVRFCRSEAPPPNRAAGELAALAASEDNAYRLLPLKVQQRVVDVLARAGRLAPWDPHRSPLLRMTYTGTTSAGKHRLTVHSRVPSEGQVHFFDSVMTVDDAGNVTLDR